MSDEVTYYVKAKPSGNGYRGFVYKYDDSGNNEIPVHTCKTTHAADTSAIADAIQWCNDKEIDCEIDFS